MLLLPLLCRVMLGLNVLWDLFSAVAIWYTFCAKDVMDLDAENERREEAAPAWWAQIARLHTSMWSRHVDAHNHAACMLMAWWVLTLGCMRLAALSGGEWLLLGIISYALEGAAFLVEALKSTMVPKSACPAGLFSLFCMVVCVFSV
jgi:hypothetical protein